MALTRRQRAIYQHTCSIYRPARTINPTTGEPTEETPTLIVEDVPCHYEYTPNVDDPTPAGRIKRMTIFTTDVVHMEVSVDVRNGDWLLNTTPAGSNTGEVHKVLGSPKKIPGSSSRNANKQSVMAMTEEHPPEGIP